MWGGGGQYLRMSGLKRGVGGFVFGLRVCGSMVSRGSQGEGLQLLPGLPLRPDARATAS